MVIKMSIEERHRAILAIISSYGSITTDRIQKEFGVSYDSAKRDLRLLEERGLLRRTHGGAIPVSDELIPRRAASGGAQKGVVGTSPLALHAASLVSDGDTIFVPGGETGLSIIENLTAESLRVVTNSLLAASMLSQKKELKSILVGGEISPDGNFYDGFAISAVRKMRFDKCFLLTDGISVDFGLSESDHAAAVFFSEVSMASKKVVGVFPAGKIGVEAPFSVCGADRLSCLITDGGEGLPAFSKLGVRVVRCEVSE